MTKTVNADIGKAVERVKSQIGSMRLGRGRGNGRVKPHKPILLLAVLDLFEGGRVEDNRIFFDQELVELFQEYFRVVQREDDWCQPAPPFFHLRSSKFWNHSVTSGRQDAYSKLRTSGGGSRRIVENIEYAYLSEDAYAAFSDRLSREVVRQFILQKFFSLDEIVKLQTVAQEQQEVANYGNTLESDTTTKEEVNPFIRSVAFRRIVLRNYDYQCAVCGLRLVLPEVPSPIDAAHLIPWSEAHDDRPTNGMALCKLHHWALDAHLISPTMGLNWRVSPLLDSRRNSEREITRFTGLPILLPCDEKFYPRTDAIRWRLQRLAK